MAMPNERTSNPVKPPSPTRPQPSEPVPRRYKIRALLAFFALTALLLAVFAHRMPDVGGLKHTTTSTASSHHEPPPFKFNHVGISVADLPSQIRWYGDILGFDRVVINYTALLPLFHTVQLMNSVGTVVELQSYAKSTRLDADKNLNPLSRAAYQGIFHFALQADGLEATYAYLGKQQVTLVAAPSCVDPYGCSAFVADPEKNIIELVHYTFN